MYGEKKTQKATYCMFPFLKGITIWTNNQSVVRG